MDERVTVGMAVYDDFDGAVFTIKSLLMYHGWDVKQIIVIDNNNESPQGQMLEKFVKNSFKPEKVLYQTLMGIKGTAVPRNMVFELASDGPVLVCDPHVLFEPNSIQAVRAYFKAHPESKDLIQGPMIYDNGELMSTHFDLSKWGGEMWGQWDTDPRGKGIEPFEIEAQGLGAFSCLKSSWLGFNYSFRGFGGEEGYIHKKYKLAGHKTLCIPQFRWWHRFGRPAGTPYIANRHDKVRNYILGHKELGMDLGALHAYFVGTGLLNQQDWDNIESGKYVPGETAKGCTSCGAAAATINDEYTKAANNKSDINEHVPTLKELATGCDVVVEFGVRTGISTVGLLAGSPGLLISFDINESQQARAIAAMAAKEGKKFEFYLADSTKVEIPECDLLFIDTKHTGEHCLAELRLHGPKVRKRIAFHDTEIYGETGEDGKAGLMYAIRQFLSENPEWSTIRHYTNNHGFTVISRDPAEQPPKLPAKWRMAINLFKSTAKDLKNGLARVPLEVAEARHAVCTSNGGVCPVGQRRIDDDRCAGCGCFLKTEHAGITPKVFRPLDACPFGLWANYIPDEVVEDQS